MANISRWKSSSSKRTFPTMQLLWGISKSEMQKRNLLFQVEDKDSYVAEMLESADG